MQRINADKLRVRLHGWRLQILFTVIIIPEIPRYTTTIHTPPFVVFYL